jgi:hypothetical protein
MRFNQRDAAAQRGASAPNVGTAPKGGPPAVVNSKFTVGMPDTNSGGTNVFVLLGKK